MDQDNIEIMTDFLFNGWALQEAVRREEELGPFTSESYRRVF